MSSGLERTTDLTEVPTKDVSPDLISLRCIFLDRSVRDLRSIAIAHDRLSKQPSPMGRTWFMLHTCERAEIYSTADDSIDPHVLMSLVGESAVTVDDSIRVQRRLAEIASGTRSVLLGEQFVFRQVQQVIMSLPESHPLRPMGLRALAVALEARGRHGFTAIADYPQLTEQLLAEGEPADGEADALLVIGGGMLAQAVLTQTWTRRYSRRVAVTRSPKRLRRRLPAAAAGTLVGRLTAPDTLLVGARRDVVIATTNLTGFYREAVQALVADSLCRAVVDLSCVPLYGQRAPARYTSLYDHRFEQLVAEQNERTAPVAERVRDHIALAYEILQ